MEEMGSDDRWFGSINGSASVRLAISIMYGKSYE